MTVRRRETLMRSAFGSAVLVAAGLAGIGCGSDDSVGEPEPAAASPQNSAAVTTEATSDATDAGAADGGAPVTQEQAELAALAAVGDGQVTWSGPEDDRGAAWEVEVTRSDGSEVDVLVAIDGSIVGQVDKDTGSADGGAGASGGQVSLQDAERIAVEAVGEGRVTWSGREDERGAAFEIEVTLDDGREVDVLIDANGNVVP